MKRHKIDSNIGASSAVGAMLLVIVTLVAITAPSAAAMLSPAQAVSSPDGGSARVQVAAQPALPEGARLLGPVSATQLMSADLALMPRNQAGLEAFADAVTSTNSPVSDRYLSPGQFAAEFARLLLRSAPSQLHCESTA